jgi:hypothetical protein
MAGIPTDHLADLIQQTNERLGDQIRESNQHLADQIEASNDRLAETNQRLAAVTEELTRRVEDGQKAFMEFRVDVAEQLSSIRNSLSVAKWAVAVLTPVILGLIGTAFWLTRHAAKLDSRVERVEAVVKSHDKTAAQR